MHSCGNAAVKGSSWPKFRASLASFSLAAKGPARWCDGWAAAGLFTVTRGGALGLNGVAGLVARQFMREADSESTVAMLSHHETFSTTIQPPYTSTKGWIV